MIVKDAYLRPNVLVEPLINQWYAWPYLVPPATASMYIANWHLKLMQSFVTAPQVHAAALKNPAMAGGPFINCEASRSGEIRGLLDKTRKGQTRLLKLAEDIKTLDQVVMNEADGTSLEHLYEKVPQGLRGFVELFYDVHNNPSYRIIEPLVYASSYYDESVQSLAFSLVNEDGRPFVFSTPRLGDPRSFHLSVPFSHEGVDELFKMKQTPQPYHRIMEMLQLNGGSDLFSSFFTDEPGTRTMPYDGGGVRIRYFGHACLLIEAGETSILCDPVISYKYDSSIPRYTFADLPDKIDYVLITHNHQDHCMFETLLQLRHKVKSILIPRGGGGSLIDPSLKLVLQRIGFKNVREVEELESIKLAGGDVTGIPFLGEHADLNIRTKIAYLIRLNGKSILCAADSNNIDSSLYRHVRELVGSVDTVFLGMECDGAPLSWLYGPLLTTPVSRKVDQSRRFDGSDFEKAITLVRALSASRVYVYAMGQEPWLTFLTSIRYTEESKPIVESNRLVEECRTQGIVSERLFGCKDIVLS
ncbi:MAG TPA: MBL fold metallo-hydrolase [Blastocatellia bacterium]|nr:MBL fold metallo-hydrolase [Blastocatellia bacterium]